MVSLQQLAALDYAYGRHQDALAKYALLHEYHHQAEQPDMQALALLGAGDTLFAAGDPVRPSSACSRASPWPCSATASRCCSTS